MNKFIITFTSICLLLSLTNYGYAQAISSDSSKTINLPYNEYKFGLGGRTSVNGMGEAALSAKYFLSHKSALQLTVGKAYYYSVTSSLLFERHHFILHSRKLRFLYGAGVTTLVVRSATDPKSATDRLKLLPTIQAGFEYNIRRTPLSIGADAKIAKYYINHSFISDNTENIAVFAHYTFGKN